MPPQITIKHFDLYDFLSRENDFVSRRGLRERKVYIAGACMCHQDGVTSLEGWLNIKCRVKDRRGIEGRRSLRFSCFFCVR